MKKTSIFLIFLFCLTSLFSQEKITITFADSTVINGYGRIKTDGNILYKKDKKGEKEIYSYKTIRKVRKLTVHNEDSDKSYEYKIIEGSGGKGSVKLLEIVKTGRINLYQETFSSRTNPSVTGGISMAYSSTTYYMSANNKNIVINLRQGNTYSKRFRKIAKKHFNDCTDLIGKIKTKEFFNRYGIKAVVDYYNEKCE